jgi:TPR repeat protein
MDPSMAAYMFSLSRSPRAYYQLAKQHLSGNGVEKNEIKALSLLEDSSSRGYSKATFVLASITEKTHPQRSAELYAAAASKGTKDAMRRLDELGLLCPETGPAHRKRHK